LFQTYRTSEACGARPNDGNLVFHDIAGGFAHRIRTWKNGQ
jgi:hypothetical protein